MKKIEKLIHFFANENKCNETQLSTFVSYSEDELISFYRTLKRMYQTEENEQTKLAIAESSAYIEGLLDFNNTIKR